MEYQKKLITIPVELASKLSKEKNQSATVVEALGRYYDGKDGTKQLAKLVLDNTEAMNELAERLERIDKRTRQIAAWMNGQGADINMVV